ncbi:MAG: hypothetical protein V4507_03555, partial [Verrucomicrobiota bacterium]
RQSVELRLPVAAPVAEVSEDVQVKSFRTSETISELQPWKSTSRLEITERTIQNVPALSFSDSSNESLGLRPMESQSSEVKRPASLSFLASSSESLGLRPLENQGRIVPSSSGIRDSATGSDSWVNSHPRGAQESLIPEGAKFKGRENEVYASDDEKAKAKLSGKKEEGPALTKTSEDEQAELLAKQNQEAKSLEHRALDDRRFQTVADRDILFSEDGRARMYAPGYRIGKFDVNMDLANRINYNDNYRFQKKAKGATSTSVSPTIEVAGGERDPEITDALYMAFRYTPSIVSYLDVNEKTIYNQESGFNTGYKFSKLSMVFDQRITGFAGQDVLAGGFTKRNVYTSSGSMEYELSEKTSLELAGNVSVRDYQDPNTFDSQDNTLKAYANYALSEKVRLGLGVGGGYLLTRGGSDQLYADALVRGVYFFSQKSTVFAETGIEQRHFYQLSTGDQYDGVFNAGGNLTLFPKTSLELDASRRQLASGTVQATNIEVTGVTVSIIQDVEKLKLVLGGGFDYIKYFPNQDGKTVLSTQDRTMSVLFKIGGRYPLKEWWDLGIDYSHRENLEKISANDLSANEVGINSKIRF